VTWPPVPADTWRADVSPGLPMAFTPKLRLVSNDAANGAVRAGWEIMAEVARRAALEAKAAHVAVFVTVIPTKELAYAERLGGQAPELYRKLVADEKANIGRFAAAMEKAGVRYVDVVKPLQAAALAAEPLYPLDENGHPFAAGYAVIAASIAAAADAALPAAPRGIVAVHYSEKEYALFLVNAEGAWSATPEMLERNGWPAQRIASLSERDLATLPMRGPLTIVDRKRFGPPPGLTAPKR